MFLESDPTTFFLSSPALVEDNDFCVSLYMRQLLCELLRKSHVFSFLDAVYKAYRVI